MNCQFSIIIPVFNESRIINTTIVQLAELTFGGRFEIIVVDGNPAGNTISVIDHYGIKKIIGSKGRGSQMNTGAVTAAGDVLLFLHADTLLCYDALDQIMLAFQQHDIVGGAFDLEITSPNKLFRLIERAASIRSRLTRIPYGDQAIFVRKRFFDQIGGFKDIPIMEDVELMQRVKRSGNKIKFIPRKARTAARRWEKEGVIRCTLRNWMLIALYLFGVPPEKLKTWYR